MSVLNGIVAELRERKLWPVALVLVLGLIAVPVLLAKQAAGVPAAPVSPSGPVTRGEVASVSVQSTPSHSRLSGPARDPFAQQALPRQATGTTPASLSSGTGSTGTGSTGSSGGAGTSSSSSSSGGSSSGASSGSQVSSGSSSQEAPSSPGTPAPKGLSATQSYDVALAITNPSGGLDKIDPLQRLSLLPSQNQPLLIELGVLQGGRRVLFAVQPGTVVGGAGNCTPGPIDCEILSLAPNQTESLSLQSQSGTVQVALFAVTSITARQYSSVAAANNARRSASAAGRRLLSKSALDALSLFQYKPSLGVVVDLRNLMVGGS